MALDVRFYKGLKTEYESLETKNKNAFYYITDDGNGQLYLGEIKISNAEDLAAAITRITTNETEIGKLKTEISTLVGGEDGQSIHDMIETAVNAATEQLEGEVGELTSLTTNTKTDLVSAINEVDAAVKEQKESLKVEVDDTQSNPEFAKIYDIKQGGVSVGKINIPKDLVVEKAEVKTLEEPDEQEHQAGTYIVLTIKNETKNPELWIDVGKLVDIYKAASDEEKTKEILVAVDNVSREISATLVDGGITTAKLADQAITADKLAVDSVTAEKIKAGAISQSKLDEDLKVAFEKAGTAIQSIITGDTPGTIKVDEEEVSVAGLGTAAYKNVEDFDAAGKADTAEANAKKYTDEALTWSAIVSE